jgi:hypothetical protein
MSLIAPCPSAAAGNAYSALKDITAISKERAWSSHGRPVVDAWVSGSFAWFSGLFPNVQVGKLNVTA